MKRAAFFFAALTAASCTIIVESSPPPPPVGGGGGFNPCLETEEVRAMPVAHVVIDVRIDRTVVNFESEYSRWMRTSVLGLWAAGIRTTRAVMIRLDEQADPPKPLAAWGCDVGGFELEPESVIHHYAVSSEPVRAATSCALDPLIKAGRDLGALVTEYPPELTNEGSGRRIFGQAPDMVLVLHLDSLARKSGLEDAACSDARTLTEGDQDRLATWLRYPEQSARGLPGVPLSQVFHMFIATDEGVDQATFIDRCRRVEGLPTNVLDVIEPSARALYEPLVQQIVGAGGAARSTSLCKMFGTHEQVEILRDQITTIASEMGTTVNAELLEAALAGQLSLPMSGEQLEIPATRPDGDS
jgi:hypothetical protein